MDPQQPTDESLSALGRARERLYKPAEIPEASTAVLSERPTSSLPHAWMRSARGFGAPHHVRFATKFFAIAVAFFLLAVGASAALFFTGSNTVSVDNVALTIQGPTTVGGGDPAPLSIIVTNKNPAALEHATLQVDFPEGTRATGDLTKAYPRYSEDLGTLASGASLEKSVSAVIFGAQGSQPVIRVSLSFGTARSNAVFVKRTDYPVTISTAPLSVSLESVTETVSGKPFTIKATIRSNATAPVERVVVGAQYPAGFSLTSSSITPVGTTFPIGTLQPGASKILTLTGTLTGQDAEERVFHFSVGTAKSANDPSLAVSYMSQEASITIAAPFLATSLTINGSSVGVPAVAPGAHVTVGINWSNALLTPVNNAEIDVAIQGNAVDGTSVQVQRGFYRSTDRTVIFSRDTDPSLGNLPPGASGLGTLSFTVLPNAPRNSTITLTLSIAGERAGQSGVPESVTASFTKTIKVVSAVTFTATSLHNSGPFTNTGPVPPVANQATSYTINWSVTNSGNDLADGAITATLPSYVTYTGVTTPTDGSFTYNDSSRTVRFEAGDIPGGAVRTGTFQVLFTPSTSQKGSAPFLTQPPTFSAFDRFAQVQVTASGSAVSTETTTDAGYTPSKGSVQ